ncbi:Alpha-1,3-mannosyl-glycoprotein 4-beta-N-acetylglucosaminyltransferase C [Desmophyllum pertusum]|uniref:Alpha-1,3-mannosyl-glycoprotein 4-beta-N-acetylglucosaminyltransferase C n=1 Tax=Desmophyllum pertusum TaxID=174260 RepID=A0A9X0CME9_9CNID|nr:Alpha-1,3-mannosyl-glycoprotein 4-beta-N-acetylglucosaminyltransferase C [Desmophyllum pertusum]
MLFLFITILQWWQVVVLFSAGQDSLQPANASGAESWHSGYSPYKYELVTLTNSVKKCYGCGAEFTNKHRKPPYNIVVKTCQQETYSERYERTGLFLYSADFSNTPQRNPSTEILHRDLQIDQREPLQKSHSFCPAKEVINSSKVSKLGRYPPTKRFLAIGISSVARPSGTSYLLETTQSLIDNTSNLDKKDIYIVIFLADLREPPKSAIREELSRTFGKYIEQGFLIVIEAYPEYYPDLNNIKAKYGDSDSRRMWRSKANVDYAFVMCYCKDFSEYYIHMEDDVKSSPSFFPKLQDFIASQTNTQWTMLHVAVQGCIAKAYHSQDLENTASFFYIMYDEMPIDWLMERWRPIKDQGPYNNRPLASLFEHIGVKSTLAEKAPHGPGALEPFLISTITSTVGSILQQMSPHHLLLTGGARRCLQQGQWLFLGDGSQREMITS